MSLNLFAGMEQSLVQSFGSLYLLALGIIIVFTIGFLMTGIDFRVVLLMDSILVIGFARMAWIPSYIEGIFWILVVGLGVYLLWTNLFNR